MTSEGGKRKSDGKDRSRRRYRSDGTPIWGQRAIDGPGVWATCVRGKEKQTVGELCDVFESLSSELWPQEGTKTGREVEEGDEEEDVDLEKQIAKEVTSMKLPKTEQRFANCETNTSCVVFISCKPPVDPVQMVLKHVQNVVGTGITQTRHTQRLTPVSDTCVANLPEVQSLCKRVVVPFFEADSKATYRYKIELRMRNHNTISKPTLLEGLAKCIPERHKVDLDNAEVFILVEIFKSICGMSVVKDYYRFQKFNVMGIARSRSDDGQEEGRMGRVSAPARDGD